MPYLQGYSLEDASGTAIGDASASPIAEPNLSFNQVFNDIAAILQALATTGAVPEVSIGVGVANLLNELAGKTPPGTYLGDYIMSMYDFTRPLYDDASNLNYLLRQLDNILAIDIGQVLDAITAVRGADNRDITEVYNIPNASVDDIWNYRPVIGDEQMYTLLQDAGRFASRVADLAALPVQNAPGFYLTGPWAASDANELPTDYPAVDWTDIEADDDLEMYLDRADPAHVWATDPVTGMVAAASTHANSVGWYWVCRFTPAEFDKLKTVATEAGNVPPVWPGLANVTLGTTIPVVASTVIEEVMDGALVTFPVVPATMGYWGTGGYKNIYHLGKYAFMSDNGQLEDFRYLGWTDALITPKSMTQAAGLVIYLDKPGIEGAVTPWTLATG